MRKVSSSAGYEAEIWVDDNSFVFRYRWGNTFSLFKSAWNLVSRIDRNVLPSLYYSNNDSSNSVRAFLFIISAIERHPEIDPNNVRFVMHRYGDWEDTLPPDSNIFDHPITKLPSIGINLWDDFYDDGYVPDGKIQSTYLYVDESTVDLSDQMRILNKIYVYIQEQKLFPNIDINLVKEDKARLRMSPITHKQLDELLDNLKRTAFEFRGVKFRFYPES